VLFGLKDLHDFFFINFPTFVGIKHQEQSFNLLVTNFVISIALMTLEFVLGTLLFVLLVFGLFPYLKLCVVDENLFKHVVVQALQ
jgi:hypothetical protein